MLVKPLSYCLIFGAMMAGPLLAAGHGSHSAAPQGRSDGRIVVPITKVSPAVNGLRNIAMDTTGIRLGMDVAQVKAILKREYKTVQPETRGALGYEYRGVSFASTEFANSIFAGSPLNAPSVANEYFNIYFGSPTQGNKVASMSRQIFYNKNNPAVVLPEYTAVQAQLIQKYGQPSAVEPGLHAMYWRYDAAGNQLNCGSFNTDCNAVVPALFSPGHQESYQRDVNAGTGYMIDIQAGVQNNVVTYLKIDITDVADQYNGSIDVTKQLDDFAKAKVEKVIKNSDGVKF